MSRLDVASEPTDVASAAHALLTAEGEARAIEPLTATWPDLDVESAYRVQDATLEHRLERGERLIGVKLGLTSHAKQQRMGVNLPLTAWLTDAMIQRTGDPVDFDRLVHPRAEPEIVFEMAERLAGPGVTAVAAMAAVGSVYAGIEIIDSRYRDFRFTLPDVIADNASSASFVVGTRRMSPVDVDLWLEACLLEVDGRVVDSATGAAVQGHPAEALALAANDLGRRGKAIEPGWLVLTGGLTDAVSMGVSTTTSASFTSLGSVVVPGGGRHAAH